MPLFYVAIVKVGFSGLTTYTTAMNRLIMLLGDLSYNPKSTKKAETESEKIEKITDKLFEELGELEEKSLKRKTKATLKLNLINSRLWSKLYCYKCCYIKRWILEQQFYVPKGTGFESKNNWTWNLMKLYVL